ncbi:hypothetical protein FCV27_17495, partial [Clostridium botulinum]|nr:hypothetical protein [Clostridium botulinum]
MFDIFLPKFIIFCAKIISSFNTYKLEQGQRLTPGAAEYLSDKGIELSDDSKVNKSSKVNA